MPDRNSTLALDREILSEYVDGQLDDNARVNVATHLAEHPADAEVVDEYRRQASAINAAFDPILSEPVPDELVEIVRKGRTESPANQTQTVNRTRWVCMSAAASVALMIAGIAGGWYYRGYQETQRLNAMLVQQFIRSASNAYVLYDRDTDRGGNFRSERMKDFVQWLYDSFGDDFTPPKLEAIGFSFAGGRLLPSAVGTAAQMTYQDQEDRRVTLYFVKGKQTGYAADMSAFKSQRFGEFDTFFLQDDKRSIYYWQRSPLKYALVGEMEQSELSKVTKDVVGQLFGSDEK